MPVDDLKMQVGAGGEVMAHIRLTRWGNSVVMVLKKFRISI
jgi:hypothetical protein